MSFMARAVRRSQIEVHSFVLMPNHFHMLPKSPHGELARPMAWIQSQYARYFNRSRGRTGPVFEGRYKSKVANDYDYRCLVVRYIDDNPGFAGMVARAAHYPYGSAWAYARAKGPPWLSRYWIDAEIREITEDGRYDPEAYGERFRTRLSPEMREWIERRLESGENESSFEDLIRASPRTVREWMAERTQLADGGLPGLPVVAVGPTLSVIDSCRRREGVWAVQRGARRVDAWNLALPGLLRTMCGLTLEEIGTRLGHPVSTVRSRIVAHVEVSRLDPGYADRCATVASEILESMRAATGVDALPVRRTLQV